MRWLGLAILAACGSTEPASTQLAVRVTENGTPVAARVQLVKADGSLLRAGTIDLFGARQGAGACVIAPAVTLTYNGIVLGTGEGVLPVGDGACMVPPGTYQVIAWRGIELERWEGTVDLSAGRGRVELAIPLTRAWTPTGAFAADTHVHAQGSNDSNMPDAQRAAAQAAAGIQVTALTNHNAGAQLTNSLGITPLAGMELTSDQMHLNVYPVELGLDPPAASIVNARPEQLFTIARQLPGRPIVQLNHPRFRVTALFDGVGWDGVAWPPPFSAGFDAMEVINGFTAFNVDGDRRIDDGIRDLYTLTDHGWLVAAMGASDTHDYNWVHDGLARTYVFAPSPAAPDIVAAIRARRTLATTGPWLEVAASPAEGAPSVGAGQTVTAGAGKVFVSVTVAAARFVKVDQLVITVGTPSGPTVKQSIPITSSRQTWSGSLDVGVEDTWIGVSASGATPLPIEQTGTYQVDKWKRAGNTPAAVISPILVDANADGQWLRSR